MKEGTESNVKFKKLKRRLGLPEWQAIGLLEAIWKLCRVSAKEGDIGRFSNEDIAASIEYAGDADEMIEALVACGWLDEDPTFRLIVHDWSEHVPGYMKGNFASHQREFADVIAKRRASKPIIEPNDDRPEDELREAVLKRDQVCQYCGGEAETIDHIVPKIRGGQHLETNLVASCFSCNGKKGSLTLEQFAKQPFCPSQFVLGRENGTVNPLLAETSEVLSGSLSKVHSKSLSEPHTTSLTGVLPRPDKTSQDQSSPTTPRPDQPKGTMSRAGPDVEVVRRLANKLLRNRRIESSLSADEVWRVAWVSAYLDESLVTDLLGAFSDGRVKKPKNYVLGAMRRACDDRGENWAELSARVGEVPKLKAVDSITGPRANRKRIE